MMHSDSNYDWDSHNQRLLRDNHAVLIRTSESINRSNQVALETEQIGTEILSNLGDQRETLLRNRDNLGTINDNLSKSKVLIRKIGRNVCYNKVLLILIIIFEIMILSAIIYIRFIKHKG